jgi:uncharacterized protein YraI
MKNKIFFLGVILILLLAACQGGDTATPEPTAVPPTEPAQPTVPPDFPEGDPRQILGAPDGVDTFDNASHWTLFDNNCFKSDITGGQFVMTAKGMQDISCWTFSWPLVHNFYLETEVVMPDSCQPNDRFGMIFRAPDNHRGYLYGLTCDGKYSLHLYDGTNTSVLVAAATNPAIKVGAGQTNRLGVAAFGNEYLLYVNGVRMATALDSTYLNPGKIGYFVNAGTTEPFTSKYNELAVWNLDDKFHPPDPDTPPQTTPVPPPPEGAPTVTTTTYVNVRNGPSTLYPVYFTAPPGGTVEVIGQSTTGQWWAVKLSVEVTPTEMGWISADYTVLSNPNNVSIPVISAPPVPPPAPIPPPQPGTTIATATDAVNVRAGPGSHFDSYGVATIGQSAPAIGQNQDGSWIAIAVSTTVAPDGVGWVVAYAVAITPADAQLPVLSPP